MTSAPRDTADDRPPSTLDDRVRLIDGAMVSPVERHPPEPPRPEEPLIAPDASAMRVAALVLAAGLTGLGGWIVFYAGSLLIDWLAGRIPKEVATPILLPLALCIFLPSVIRRLWRVARWGVDLTPENIEAIESHAFLEAVERHDRLVEARRSAAEGVQDEPRP